VPAYDVLLTQCFLGYLCFSNALFLFVSIFVNSEFVWPIANKWWNYCHCEPG